MNATAPAREALDARLGHPVRRTVLSLLALGLLIGAVVGVRHQVSLLDAQSRMQRAFDIGAIEGEQWMCSSDSADGRLLSSCYPPQAPGPTVDYELLPAPQTTEDLVAEVEAANRRAIAEDRSGTTPKATLLGTDDWTPTGETGPWGTVTRWRYEGGGPGTPAFRTTYRYADAPFGLTVYAGSPTRIDELVGSLTLLPPDRLPD